MGAVTHYIEVHAPVQACYDWWRNLTRLPEIMTDVRQVTTRRGHPDITDWEVAGPMGSTLEWTARIVEEASPRKISWSTVGDGDDVASRGAVSFVDKGRGLTGVEIQLEYSPPVGKVGEVIAAIFDDPQSKVEQAAVEFKTLIEAR
ncbi:SRPBCC family protein [Actinokineospora sp. NBRC 105648]|uniref:SRPBCC family protein n=1 Tax=Actinokineospora sp. NBRC 105648 TaxID=3032206 RepID=UPI0024A22672|nr:SRPBCC family protein [Actinokineospora sp. NBRC 105648]GLZ40557.1 hypothetical protein Acsp05_41810 [Actinokineospora sp. NBRC 105648]